LGRLFCHTFLFATQKQRERYLFRCFAQPTVAELQQARQLLLITYDKNTKSYESYQYCDRREQRQGNHRHPGFAKYYGERVALCIHYGISARQDSAKFNRCNDILEMLSEAVPSQDEAEFFIKCLSIAFDQETDINKMSSAQIEQHPLIVAMAELGELVDQDRLDALYNRMSA
jgi:hypothetical protein